MRTIDRYVYHPSWEPNPHPYGSKGENVVTLGYVADGFAQRGRIGLPNAPIACPAWGCGGGPDRWYPIVDMPPRPTPIMMYPPYGSTNTVPQPPPIGRPPGGPILPVTAYPPISPAPSPTVAVSPTQTAPQLTQPGTVLDSSGASITTAGGIGTWLAQSSIDGIPNWGLAAGAVLVAVMFMGRGGRR